jgi:hypothetical protein
MSKTLEEKAAWEFTREKGLQLVELNPAMVLGSFFMPIVNSSLDVLLLLLTGQSVVKKVFILVLWRPVLLIELIFFRGD